MSFLKWRLFISTVRCVFSCSPSKVPEYTDHKKCSHRPYSRLCVQLPHLHRHNSDAKFNAPSGRQEVAFPFSYLCPRTYWTPEDKQSLVPWVDIYTHTQYTRSHNTARSLLAALVKYSASNSGTKSPADFAHPCYFQPRATVLAGCLPCSGEPGEAQLSRGRREGGRASPLPHLPHGAFGGAQSR